MDDRRQANQAQPEFERFVESSADRLLRAAYLITWDLAEAEDLVQECLLRVARRWPRVRKMDHPTAYARTVLVHLALDQGKHRTRRRAQLAEATASPLDQHEDVAAVRVLGRVEASADLMQALGELPPRQRVALVLRYFEDLSEADVAEAMGCSVGTVKSTTSRALERLRRVIDAPAETTGSSGPTDATTTPTTTTTTTTTTTNGRKDTRARAGGRDQRKEHQLMTTGLEEQLSEALASRAASVPPTATHRLRTLDYHPRRHRLGVPVAVGAGAAASAATAGTVLAVVLGGAAPAYAGWSPAPTAAPTAAPSAQAGQNCLNALPSNEPAGGQLGSGAWQSVLTDVRGPFTVALFQNDGAYAACFTSASFTSVSQVSADNGSASNAEGASGTERSLGAGGPSGGLSTVTVGGTSSGDLQNVVQTQLSTTADGPYTLVDGRVRVGRDGRLAGAGQRTGRGDHGGGRLDGRLVAG